MKINAQSLATVTHTPDFLNNKKIKKHRATLSHMCFCNMPKYIWNEVVFLCVKKLLIKNNRSKGEN